MRVTNQTAEQTPLALATKLGDRGFFTWDGNYYALNLTEHLDVNVAASCVSASSTTTQPKEVDRLLEALRGILEA